LAGEKKTTNMNHQPSEDQLHQIASQLSKPTGEDGVKTAELMHINNIGMTRSAIEELSLTKNDVVLELGHGNGKHIEEILSKAEAIAYHGLEISELMHLTAREGNLWDNTSFKLYDGLNIPFEANYFTKILTVNTLYFWKDPIYLLNEIHRVLKPDGKFCCAFAPKDFMEKLPFTKFVFELYDINKVEKLIQASYFTNFEFKEYVEQITQRDGESIERNYTVLSLAK
jgi:ubiquinone/menaquinone biosynthesis C-methylase UbiE